MSSYTSSIYKAVLFDAGGTLVNPDPSFAKRFAITCNNFGLSLDVNKICEVEQKLWEYALTSRSLIPYTSHPEKSKEFWLWFYNMFLCHLGHEGENDVVEELYEVFSSPATYKLYDDVIPCLESIKEYGVVMGVVSNWERWLPDLLNQCNIIEYFSAIVVSGDVGIEKPDQRIFQIALNKLNVLPQETLYVGDWIETDILPAIEVGMVPLLIDRKGTHTNGISCRRLSSLTEISLLF